MLFALFVCFFLFWGGGCWGGEVLLWGGGGVVEGGRGWGRGFLLGGRLLSGGVGPIFSPAFWANPGFFCFLRPSCCTRSYITGSTCCRGRFPGSSGRALALVPVVMPWAETMNLASAWRWGQGHQNPTARPGVERGIAGH